MKKQEIKKLSKDEVIKNIENRMKELAKSSQEISRMEISASDAVKMFDDMGESYKVEIITEIDPNDIISAYTQTSFTDLCRVPHVSNTSKIKYFKSRQKKLTKKIREKNIVN